MPDEKQSTFQSATQTVMPFVLGRIGSIGAALTQGPGNKQDMEFKVNMAHKAQELSMEDWMGDLLRYQVLHGLYLNV